MRGTLSIPRGEEHLHLQRQRDTERNLNEQALLSDPQFILTSYSSLSYLSMTFHFIKPNIKILRFNHFFESSFPYEDFCIVKLRSNKFVCFFSCLCLFNFQAQPDTLRRLKKSFSSPPPDFEKNQQHERKPRRETNFKKTVTHFKKTNE